MVSGDDRATVKRLGDGELTTFADAHPAHALQCLLIGGNVGIHKGRRDWYRYRTYRPTRRHPWTTWAFRLWIRCRVFDGCFRNEVFVYWCAAIMFCCGRRGRRVVAGPGTKRSERCGAISARCRPRSEFLMNRSLTRDRPHSGLRSTAAPFVRSCVHELTDHQQSPVTTTVNLSTPRPQLISDVNLSLTQELHPHLAQAAQRWQRNPSVWTGSVRYRAWS